MKDDSIRSISSIDNIPRQRPKKKTQQERGSEYESEQPSMEFLTANNIV